jgi:hypothetical protein
MSRQAAVAMKMAAELAETIPAVSLSSPLTSGAIGSLVSDISCLGPIDSGSFNEFLGLVVMTSTLSSASVEMI